MPKAPKRTRLNLRIPTDLLEWAKEHVEAKNTNLTQLIVDHLTRLKEKADGRTA